MAPQRRTLVQEDHRKVKATKKSRNTPEEIQQLAKILHDLVQPLTNLQCRLEMAEIVDTAEEYREAVALGATECVRLSGHVTALRELIDQLR